MQLYLYFSFKSDPLCSAAPLICRFSLSSRLSLLKVAGFIFPSKPTESVHSKKQARPQISQLCLLKTNRILWKSSSIAYISICFPAPQPGNKTPLLNETQEIRHIILNICKNLRLTTTVCFFFVAEVKYMIHG